MNCDNVIADAWLWLDSYWARHNEIMTMVEDKQLDTERKNWYKSVMPQLKNADVSQRQGYADTLNIIYNLSDMSHAYPDHWSADELLKWKQKYEKM